MPERPALRQLSLISQHRTGEGYATRNHQAGAERIGDGHSIDFSLR